MKWLIFGILGWFGFSVIGSFSAPAFRDFDSATLKIALKDQKKVVVVEYYSDT